MEAELGHDIVLIRPGNYMEDRYTLDDEELDTT